MNYLGFVEASTLVTIHYPSLTDSAPISQVVLEGNNLTLRCSASGNLTPNITWTKDKSSSVLHQGDTYSIVDIDRNAAGNYTCTAWNGVGEPKKAIAAVSVHYPAEIVTRPKDQVLWLGENTTLVCDAVGNPVPNRSYSVLGENASVVYSKTLVIKSSSVTYVKMYTCTAFNGVQPPVSVNATVTVLVRPCSRSPCANGNCTDIKTPPSYRCSCPSGYQGRHCIQQITKETDRVRGSVKLERCPYKYHPDYNNHSSEMYKELSNDFIKNMTLLYENEKQFGLVTVNDIYSDASDNVMVNFTLVFFKGNKTVDELHQVLEKSVENGRVYSLPVQRGTLRLTLITTPAPATAIPPAVAARSKKIEPWNIVVVAAIGGLVFLVLVCAIIACCGRRRKKKKDVSQGYEEHTGKWIDLPHGENGNKPSKEEYAMTNSVAYMEGGPYQERAVEEKEPESNGNNTHM